MDPVRAELVLADHLYDQQIVELVVRRAHLPVIDRLDVVFPPQVTLEAGPGDTVELRLDGGEGIEAVFAGTVSHVVRGIDRLELTAHGGAAKLAQYRPALTLEGKTAGDVIQSLCGDVDVSVGSVDDGPSLALFVADGRSTAAEEIAELAALTGSRAGFDAADTLHASSEGPGQDVALRYGRELIDLRAMASAPDGTARTVVGEGAESAGQSKALWIISDFLGGGTAPGPEARRRALPRVRDKDDASVAGNAWSARVGERRSSVRMRTWLLPQLAPGARVVLEDVPGHVGLTECRVQQVVHLLSARRGARTDVWGTSQTNSGGLLG